MEDNYKYDYYICYRHQRAGDCESVARYIRAILAEYGVRVFLNVHDIVTGTFMEQLDSVIKSTKAFILILNEESWREHYLIDYFYLEIIKIMKQNKPIVLIELTNGVLRNIPLFLEKQLPNDLSHYQVIRFDPNFKSELCDFLGLQLTKNYINDSPIYITYARNDKNVSKWEHIADVVDVIVDKLRKNNISVWVDERDAENGEVITDFEKKIGESEYTILIFSDKYFQSLHCMYEFKEIKNGLLANKKKKILYIKSGEFDINMEYIQKLQRKWMHHKTDIEFDLKTIGGNVKYLTEIQRKTIENNYYEEEIKTILNLKDKSYWNADDIDYVKLINTVKSWFE